MDPAEHRLDRRARPARQGRYWIETISVATYPDWTPPAGPPGLPDGVIYARGQKELGAGGFEHWQLMVAFKTKTSLAGVTTRFPGHWELTRSDAAREYVWKEVIKYLF